MLDRWKAIIASVVIGAFCSTGFAQSTTPELADFGRFPIAERREPSGSLESSSTSPDGLRRSASTPPDGLRRSASTSPDGLRRSASSEATAYDESDLFDYLGRLDPDANERPANPSIALPDSLDQYSRELFGARTPELDQYVRWLVLKNLPPSYEDNRKWGLQKDVYDGFRFRREGLKIETERKYRTVKHGTWSRYYVQLIDPANKLVLRVERIEPIADDRIAVEATLEAPLHAFGRISQWQRNVQWISLSTNADATVRVWVQAEIGIRTNPLVFPPEVQFTPVVKDAKVQLIAFEVHRISQVSGPLAEQLGKGIRKVVDDRLDDFSDKLVSKMNQQLIKQQEKLKVSVGEEVQSMLQSWNVSRKPRE